MFDSFRSSGSIQFSSTRKGSFLKKNLSSGNFFQLIQDPYNLTYNLKKHKCFNDSKPEYLFIPNRNSRFGNQAMLNVQAMLSSRDIQEVFKLIEDEKPNFFVGAGISKSGHARLPGGPELIKVLIKNWVSDDVDISKLNECADSGLLRLEVLMQISKNTFADPQAIIDPLLPLVNALPNKNHYFLAIALKKGCNVITTNFDILIETAYWNLFGTLPPTIITEDQFRSSPPRGSLLKLHGSIGCLKLEGQTLALRDARETVIASLNQVAQGLGEVKSKILMQLVCQAPTLVWGYSCMDDFDILPVFIKCKDTRRPFYWTYFQRDISPHVTVDEEWDKVVSNVFSDSVLENPRRFKITNLSAVFVQNDLKIVGDLSSWVHNKLHEDHNCKINSEYREQFKDQTKIFIDNQKQTGKITTPERNLLTARLLVQMEIRGEMADKLFSSVYQSQEFDPDFCLKICTEHAEAVIPIELEKAWKILNDKLHENKNSGRKIEVNTLATALYTLSNIQRRLKKKDANAILNEALELMNDAQMNDITKHLLYHYNGLILHQEVAEEVKYVKGDSSVFEPLLMKIDRCEKQFQETSKFFLANGLIEYCNMSRNALGLLLIEKGNALKAGGREAEAKEVFGKAAEILQNVGIIRTKYGFFRGVGQAYRNVTLAHQGQGNYKDALDAISKSMYFYSLAKPLLPESDYYEAVFRQAELYLQLNQPEDSIQPLSAWITRKRENADWHDEARGLKLLFKANLMLNRNPDVSGVAKQILAIYQNMLKDSDNRQVLKNRRFGVKNGQENLIFVRDNMPKDMIDEYGEEVNRLIKELDEIT